MNHGARGWTGKCLAVCQECSGGAPGERLGAYVVPFDDPGKRDAYMAEHTAAYRHHVAPVNGWPGARRAYRIASQRYGWTSS
jgi:hypothetical protein